MEEEKATEENPTITGLAEALEKSYGCLDQCKVVAEKMYFAVKNSKMINTQEDPMTLFERKLGETQLAIDLGLDSLESMDTLMDLEDSLNIEVPNTSLNFNDNKITVLDVMKVLYETKYLA